MDTLQAFIHGTSNGERSSGKGSHIIPGVNVLLQIKKRNTIGHEANIEHKNVNQPEESEKAY